MYDYNLLVSCHKGVSFQAIIEIKDLLKRFGDPKAKVEKTIAANILGVKTRLCNRDVIKNIIELFKRNPLEINFTIKWVPIDRWCEAEIDDMKRVVNELKGLIKKGERWAMVVEKRRYTKMHRIEIINELAPLIKEKVDLKNPDKILRIDIIGKWAGLAVLKPDQIFSSAKLGF